LRSGSAHIRTFFGSEKSHPAEKSIRIRRQFLELSAKFVQRPSCLGMTKFILKVLWPLKAPGCLVGEVAKRPLDSLLMPVHLGHPLVPGKISRYINDRTLARVALRCQQRTKKVRHLHGNASHLDVSRSTARYYERQITVMHKQYVSCLAVRVIRSCREGSSSTACKGL